MKILMVLTSHDQLGNTGRKTGFWLEEFAAPYYVFRDAGVELTLASPKGGQPPIDPKSDLPENQTPAMTRFKQDPAAQKDFATTAKLADMRAEDFDAIFYPGGHGPMWDLADNPVSIALIESFYNSGKPVAAGLPRAGRAASRHLSRASRSSRASASPASPTARRKRSSLTHVVPFLVEDELEALGGLFEKAPNWQSFAITDGRLITGQNPASSTAGAEALVTLLRSIEAPAGASHAA